MNWCVTSTAWWLVVLLGGTVLADDQEPKTSLGDNLVASEIVKVQSDSKGEPVVQGDVKAQTVSPPPVSPKDTTETNSFTQVIGGLLTQLLQAPVVFINAVSRVISRITGSIPTPYR